MSEFIEIVRRKDEHLDLALRGQAKLEDNPFDAVDFLHSALPELDLDEIDLSTRFLEWPVALPFLISSMTGGPLRGECINRNLALAAQALGIPFAVGSQRVALEGAGSIGLDRELRRLAPSTPIWANVGAAQLVKEYGLDHLRRAIDMIEADALVIHLNPLQEAVQPNGDRAWRGVTSAIARVASGLHLPVIVKEVGFRVSAAVALRLAEAGVAAVDVAGVGGTAWAAIEAERCKSDSDRGVARAFTNWGLPTTFALRQVRSACPELPLIGSGGVRNGVDAAKAIRLGADLVGQAGGVLQAALKSPEAVIEHFNVMARQLKIACFCTGSPDLRALRSAPLVNRGDALPVHDV